MMKRNLLAALLLLTIAAPVFAQTPPSPSKVEGPKAAAQDEFVPVSAPINPQDTLPAPRLVAIAYGFIWVVLLGYVWSVRSRLTRVEHEIEAVSRRLPERK